MTKTPTLTRTEQFEELRRLIFCPPTAAVLTGPEKTGKWRTAVQVSEFAGLSDVLQVDGSIDGARQAASFLKSMPLDGVVRLVVVDGRSGISEPAQDAYLKTCEETPEFASILFVAEDANLLRPALLSRLTVLHWSAATADEVRATTEVDDFVATMLRGRTELCQTATKNAVALRALYDAAIDLANSSLDLTRAPSMLTEWSKLDDDCKKAAILACEAAAAHALEAPRLTSLLLFVDVLRTCPSANVEVHWWRACMAV